MKKLAAAFALATLLPASAALACDGMKNEQTTTSSQPQKGKKDAQKNQDKGQKDQAQPTRS